MTPLWLNPAATVFSGRPAGVTADAQPTIALFVGEFVARSKDGIYHVP